MRYVYISLIVVVTAVVLLFKIQNFEAVTVSLFGAGITMPTSLLIFVVYTLRNGHGECVARFAARLGQGRDAPRRMTQCRHGRFFLLLIERWYL